MKNKFLTILIILLGYNSSKITAMEIQNIENNENLVNFVTKKVSYTIDTNNQIIKAAITKHQTNMSSNISLDEKNWTTNNLHGKSISSNPPHIFLVDSKNPTKTPTILIPENLFFSTIIYRADIESQLNHNNPEKINIKELDQYITDSDNGVILLKKAKIETYIKNSIILLKKKNILQEKYLFDIEDLVAKMLENPTEIRIDPKSDYHAIWENRKIFILYILDALKTNKITILKFNKIEERLHKRIEKFLQDLYKQALDKIFLFDESSEMKQVVKLKMDMDPFIPFFYKTLIPIYEKFSETYEENDLDKHLSPIERYTLKSFMKTKKTNNIEQNTNKLQLEVTNKKDNNSQELNNIMNLLFTIKDITFAFSNEREMDGGDATAYGTHSIAYFDIRKNVNEQFLLPLLTNLQNNKINDSPKIPTFLFLNYPEQAEEIEIEKQKKETKTEAIAHLENLIK